MPKRLFMAVCSLLLSTAVFTHAAEVPVVEAGGLVGARFEGISDADLKAYFLRCSGEAAQRMLGFSEGAQCSSAQDALKARVFGGDFNALLAWWRSRREQPAE